MRNSQLPLKMVMRLATWSFAGMPNKSGMNVGAQRRDLLIRQSQVVTLEEIEQTSAWPAPHMRQKPGAAGRMTLGGRAPSEALLPDDKRLRDLRGYR